MHVGLILGAGFGLGLLATVGYAYFEGKKSCKDSFLVEEQKQRIVELERRVKQSQDATIEATKLSKDAADKADQREKQYAELIKGLDGNDDGPVCVDVGFLRKLRGNN